MSNLQTVQGILPEFARATQSNTAGSLNMINPSKIIINVNDSKSNTTKQDDGDRQNHSENDNDNSKSQPKSGYKYWSRRIMVGKNEQEEREEKKYHKRLNFFKAELRRHMAEFIGTFLIVFFLNGIQINQELFPIEGHVGNVDKGLIAGLMLIGLIFGFGKVSGAHFNPCVSLAFTLRGAIFIPRFISYIIIQFAGAISGAAVLYGIFGSDVIKSITASPGPGLREKDALAIVIIVTFFLINVVLATAQNGKLLGATSGLAMGATFGSLQMYAWNFTGSAVNPWRAIAPIIISGVGWSTYWIYIVGPLVGTILAVLVQRLMTTDISPEDLENRGIGDGKNNGKSG